jgi:kinesin family member C2/C3
LDEIKSQTENNASITTEALKEKEDEILRLKTQEATLSDQVTVLKRGTSKMLSKLKFELATLNKQNKTLRVSASDTVGRAEKVFNELAPVVRQMATIYLDNDLECKELRKKYQKEVLQRKLLYNKIQELKGNIRVFCRVRYDPRVPVALKFISETELMVPTGVDQRTKLFEFDHVYPPETTQAAIYEDASGIIMSCIDGYNVCFLAYGQTGSGKTWTMMGPPNDAVNAGVNRRAVHDLFRMCGEREDFDYKMSISMLEIYNENVYDLLSGHHSESLRVLQEGDGGTRVESLISRDVGCADDVRLFCS